MLLRQTVRVGMALRVWTPTRALLPAAARCLPAPSTSVSALRLARGFTSSRTALAAHTGTGQQGQSRPRPSSDEEEAAEERDRASRVAAMRERLRKSWSLKDPLHLQFLFSEVLARAGVKDPDMLSLAATSAMVATYFFGGLTVAGEH
jgi:hypothetical protein